MVSQVVLWEGAQVLTPVMLQRPLETASCFPVGLIGKAAEASLERGKKKKALLLSLKLDCEIQAPGKAARSFC